MPAPVLQFKRGNAGVAGTVPALRPGEPAISLNNFDFFIGIDTSVANNKFFGSHRYWGREDGTNSLNLKLVDKDGTNSINLKAPNTLAGVTTYTFPATPTADYFLKTGADGTLSWAAVSLNSFSGIVTFTDATDNTLGNADTGSVQIDGGVGINKNLTVGAGLSVVGTSRFAGDVTFASAAYFGDGDKLYFGDGNDLEIFHNGDNSFIKDTGTGTLNVVASGFSVLNAGANETLANFNPDGSVELYYDNVKKFETTGVGATITGSLGVSGDLNVAGQSYFIGTATFYGGQINLGDSDTDDIVVAGEFKSNLIPSDDATYSLGTGAKRWNNASFAGVGTFATGLVGDGVQIGINGANVIDTVSGNLTLNSAGGSTIIDDAVTIQNNLTVNGNVTIGGTTVTLRGQDVFIENKDIILGYTTSITPNDDTANHAGVAIASTVGTPLANFDASGINTLPSTYKQLMWFKSGTLGFSTDAFAFNYGVAIGTTTMANGVRLAVGSGVTVSDTSVSATNFYGALTGNVNGNASSADQVKTVTASDTNANYYVTFVDSHNGSATNENVYTDDGIYYNPGANKLTTQHAEFTGDVIVSGITSLGGNVSLGNSGSDVVTVVGVTTFTTSNVYINNQLYVGGIQIVGSGSSSSFGEDIVTRNLSASGISTLSGLVNANGGIDVTGHTELDNVNVSGATTVTSLNATGNVTLGDTSGDTVTVKGTATFEQPIVGTIGTATRTTTVDTTGTSTNADYYVTFVDTLAGETGETLRVGAGLSVNPSTGNVGVSSILSVGNVNAVNAFIKAGGGSNALYLYSNGDVSFQAKAVVNEIRSSSNATTLISLSDLDATFARNVTITGITTTSQLTVGTGVGITQFSSSVSTGTSTSSVPTSSAVIDYVGSQVSGIDLTTSLAGDSGTGSVNTSQTLTIAGTVGEIETSASGQTITVGLPNTVIVGTALSAPTLLTATLQHRNGTQAATIDTSGNITASQDLTVSGNLYVNGSTTQVNTSSMTVEDRTIELGLVDGSTPGSATTWDLGVLFNYNSSGAKKSAVVWEHADGRFKFGSQVSDGGGTDNNSPQITVSNYAAIEIGALWVNDCAGQSQVISCTGTERFLENITVDAGTF